MNTDPPPIPQAARRASAYRNTGKILLVAAIVFAVVGFLGGLVAASVFTLKSVTPLVDTVGAICFWGFLPVLFLAGLLGIAALFFWNLGSSRKL